MFVTDEMVEVAFKTATGRLANKDTMRDALKAALETAETTNPQTAILDRIATALERMAGMGGIPGPNETSRRIGGGN